MIGPPVPRALNEFGIAASGQKIAVPLISVPQLKSLGVDAIQGLVTSNGFVWNRTAETTAWSKRFESLTGAMPADTQATNYSSLLHYLRAVEAAGTTDADAVMQAMRETPVDDVFGEGGMLRPNGSMVHDIYLIGTTPKAEMTGPWDIVRVIRTIPGDNAFRKRAESTCPLVANSAVAVD